MKKRLIGVLFTAAAFALLAVAPASAAAPSKDTFTVDASDTITDICPSPIHLQVHADVMELVWVNSDGVPTRVTDHVAEHDVFSAHGVTIPTDTYHYTVHVPFDSQGNPLHAYATGVVVRMRLPDGTQFSSAGRVDVLQATGPFTIVPDVGHSGNIDAFCQAFN